MASQRDSGKTAEQMTADFQASIRATGNSGQRGSRISPNKVSGALEEASYCRCEAPPIGMVLHPHLSIFNIVLHYIEDFLSIWGAHDLKLRVPELDREEDIVLPGYKDCAVIDWYADIEADSIVRKEYKLGGVPSRRMISIVEILFAVGC